MASEVDVAMLVRIISHLLAHRLWSFEMSQPAARMGDMTATADPILGPGTPTVLVMGQPVSNIGDAVTGPVLGGAVAKASLTVLCGCKPTTRMGDTAVGAHVMSGVPLTLPILMPCAPTVLMGG